MPKTVHAVSEGKRFAGDTSLTVVSCYACHMTYAIPESLYRAAQAWPGDQDRGWKLTCPLGHTWWFTGQNLEQQLERERERVQEERRFAGRLAAERDQARAETTVQKRRASRFKNDRDRIKTRVAAGVCPSCNRTFQNLARHMAGQHPDYAHGHDHG